MKKEKTAISKNIIIILLVSLFVFVCILLCHDKIFNLFSKNQEKLNSDDVKKEVEDNEPITLKLRELIVEENQHYSIDDFVVECLDNNEEQCDLKYEDNKMSNYSEEGIYKIIIVATDKKNNKATEKTILKITKLPSEDENLNEENIDNSNKLSENDDNKN